MSIESFRLELLERQRVLTEEIRGMRARTKDDPFRSLAGEVGDSGDESTASALIDTEHAEADRDLHELRAVEAALERIAVGQFGLCVDCGDAISIERLQAYPTAERCIRCQSQHEKTHAHPPHSRL